MVKQNNLSKIHQFFSRIKALQTLSRSKGFTLVELVIVIVIIGVISVTAIVSYNGWKQSTVVTQLKNDLNGVAVAMENDRTFNNVYPASVPATFKPSQNVTLSGGSVDAGKTYCVSAVNSQFSNLYYYVNSTIAKQGAQLGNCGPVGFVASTVSISSISLSWTAVSGATSYVLQQDTNANFSNATTIATQAGTTYTSTGLAGSTTYYYRVKATVAGVDSGWSIFASASTVTIAPPTVPAVPTVTASTSGATTTYSWGAATCIDTTARYQYRYTINSSIPQDSGIIATDLTSFPATTSTEGLTYTLTVQAECYNTVTAAASGMSTAGSSVYYRPYSYTLTLTAGTGGTVSQSGTSPYTAGATPTIIATPSANYSFTSWSGTNCSGIASHAVSAMTANLDCTANFTIITYTLTLTAGTGGTVSGTGTFNSGTSPTMTATPSGIYVFSSWGGSSGCSGSANQTITQSNYFCPH